MSATIEVSGVNHVGIITRDFDAVRSVFSATLGIEVAEPELDPALGLEILWVHVGDLALEFLRAADPESETGRRLAQKQGVDHVALTVADVGAALERARADGIPTLDPSPRRGVRGSRIGFLDPQAVGGTLLEFVEPAAD
jgi:methylmalonyl-CoA/ethylmalonyl-CoA epimerase